MKLLQSGQDSSARKVRWASDAVALLLTSAATALMMLCPCDTVGMRDYKAISLICGAALLGIAAATVLYHRIPFGSGTTGFMRGVVALVIAGVSVYLELILAMEVVAFLARER